MEFRDIILFKAEYDVWDTFIARVASILIILTSEFWFLKQINVVFTH